MPRQKRPAGTTVDKRNGAREALPGDGGVPGALKRFDPPKGLCVEAQEAWEDFWTDRPSMLMTPSSRTVLRRWINALNRYLVTLAEADLQPITTGSTGQETVNPLYKIAEQARATMESCERQLGIGGLNASSLGLAAIQERKSLADMNARYSGGATHDDTGPNAPEDDPRVLSGVLVEPES